MIMAKKKKKSQKGKHKHEYLNHPMDKCIVDKDGVCLEDYMKGNPNIKKDFETYQKMQAKSKDETDPNSRFFERFWQHLPYHEYVRLKTEQDKGWMTQSSSDAGPSRPAKPKSTLFAHGEQWMLNDDQPAPSAPPDPAYNPLYPLLGDMDGLTNEDADDIINQFQKMQLDCGNDVENNDDIPEDLKEQDALADEAFSPLQMALASNMYRLLDLMGDLEERIQTQLQIIQHCPDNEKVEHLKILANLQDAKARAGLKSRQETAKLSRLDSRAQFASLAEAAGPQLQYMRCLKAKLQSLKESLKAQKNDDTKIVSSSSSLFSDARDELHSDDSDLHEETLSKKKVRRKKKASPIRAGGGDLFTAASAHGNTAGGQAQREPERRDGAGAGAAGDQSARDHQRAPRQGAAGEGQHRHARQRGAAGGGQPPDHGGGDDSDPPPPRGGGDDARRGQRQGRGNSGRRPDGGGPPRDRPRGHGRGGGEDPDPEEPPPGGPDADAASDSEGSQPASRFSIFGDTQLERMVANLKEVTKHCQDAIDNHRQQKPVLERVAREGQNMYNTYLQKRADIEQIAPNDAEALSNQGEALYQLITRLTIALSELETESDARRRAPREAVPNFNGDCLDFESFRTQFLEATRHFTSEQTKIASLKDAFIGSHKNKLTSAVVGCLTLQDCFDSLERFFGNFESMYPSVVSRLRNQKTPGDSQYELEKNNSMEFLKFYRWLKVNNKTELGPDMKSSYLRSIRRPNSERLVMEGINSFEEIEKFTQNVVKTSQILLDSLKDTGRDAKDNANSHHGGRGSGFHHSSSKMTDVQPTKSQAPYTFDKPCNVCHSTEHSTAKCHVLKSLRSVPAVKNKLKQSGVCWSCLKPNDRNHSCSPTYLKQGKPYPRTCGRGCNSGLNGLVCPCQKNNHESRTHHNGGSGGYRPQQSQQQQQHGSGGGVVAGHSRANATGAGSGPVVPALPPPTISNRSSQVAGHFTRKSGCFSGIQITPAQTFFLVAPDGSKIPVILMYDSCSNNSFIRAGLEEYSWESLVNVNYFLETLNKTERKQGVEGVYKFQSIYNEDIQFNVNCLSQDMTNQRLSSTHFYVPNELIAGGAPDNWFTASGPVTVVLGQTDIHLHPREQARFGRLIYSQSVIDGENIFAGSVAPEMLVNNTQYSFWWGSGPSHTRCNRISVRHDNSDFTEMCRVLLPYTVDTPDTPDRTEQVVNCEKTDKPENVTTHSLAEDNQEFLQHVATKQVLCSGEVPVLPQAVLPAEGLRAGRGGDAEDESRLVRMLQNYNFATGALACSECQTRSAKCAQCADILDKNPKQRHEEAILSSSLVLENGRWTADPQHNMLLASLPDYREETLKFQKKLETKLLKNPDLLSQYNKAMEKRLESGLYIWYSDLVQSRPDVDFTKLQKCYSPNNYQLKPGSQNNSCRIVMNSSFKPFPHKPSLNQTMYTGSSLNKHIQHILLYMRQFPYFSSSDIDAFYHRIKCSPRSACLNLMFYRRGGLGSSSPWETIVSDSLQPGQSQCQYIANRAKYLTSEMFILPISAEAHDNIEYSLTDDVWACSFSEQGRQKIKEAIQTGLAAGGFVLKPWRDSGGPEEEEQMLGASEEYRGILGIGWKPSVDRWRIDTSVNLAAKIRGIRSPEYLISNVEDIDAVLSKTVLTRRSVLRALSSVYDPLAQLIQIRFLMAHTFRNALRGSPTKVDWDQPLPNSVIPDLKMIFTFLCELKNVTVPRCVCQDINTELECEAVAVVDGSPQAAASRIFLRYRDTNGDIRVNYVFGTVHLTSPSNNTAVKAEVESLLAGARALQTLKQVFKYLHITRYFLLSDSQIALQAVCSSTLKQKTFYSVRNFQARQIISELKISLYHINSPVNDCDLATKVIHENKALLRSYWHSFFLEIEDIADWPAVQHQFDETHLQGTCIIDPKLAISTSLSTNIYPSILSLLYKKYRYFRKVLNVLTYIILWKSSNRFEAQREAKLIMIRSSPPEEDVIKGVRRQFLVTEDSGVYYVLPRRLLLNQGSVQQKLVLASGHSELGVSVLHDAHVHIAGVGAQIARMIQQGFFISGARNFFKRLSESCLMCRRLRKKQLSQQMGHSIQAQVKKNFNHMEVIFTDVIGPLKRREPGKGSKTRKLFVIGISCVVSRFSTYVCLEDMTCGSILQGLRTACLRTGAPLCKVVLSDKGSSFLPLLRLETGESDDENDDDSGGADNEALGDTTVQNLRRYLHKHNIIWKVSTPHAPFRNSSIEISNKLLKMCLKRSGLLHQTHSLLQWEYILAKACYTMNKRALNFRYLDDNFEICSPRSLVYGQNRSENMDNFDINLENIDTIRDQRLFEKQIQIDQSINYFNHLYTRSYALESLRVVKWRHEKRPLSKGDICIILDRYLEGKPSLAIVTDILSPRSYKLVYNQKLLTCDNNFKVTKKAKLEKILRPAQQLVLVCSKQEAESPQSLEPVQLYNDADNGVDTVQVRDVIEDQDGAARLDDGEGVPRPGQQPGDAVLAPEQHVHAGGILNDDHVATVEQVSPVIENEARDDDENIDVDMQNESYADVIIQDEDNDVSSVAARENIPENIRENIPENVPESVHDDVPDQLLDTAVPHPVQDAMVSNEDYDYPAHRPSKKVKLIYNNRRANIKNI